MSFQAQPCIYMMFGDLKLNAISNQVIKNVPKLISILQETE
jgi:hypothetical protein